LRKRRREYMKAKAGEKSSLIISADLYDRSFRASKLECMYSPEDCERQQGFRQKQPQPLEQVLSVSTHLQAIEAAYQQEGELTSYSMDLSCPKNTFFRKMPKHITLNSAKLARTYPSATPDVQATPPYLGTGCHARLPERRKAQLTISDPELLPTVTAAAKKFGREFKDEPMTAAASRVEVAP
jgi:hypothetical protein